MSTIKELLQLHWMDGAKLSGGSYANEPSLDYKQTLETLEAVLLEELIGADVEPKLDPDEGYCTVCYFQATDGSNDCRCIYDNLHRAKLRTRLTKLLNKEK